MPLVDLPLVDLFQASGLEDMAAQIQGSSTNQKTASEIDWDYETTLPTELSETPKGTVTGKKPRSTNEVIILTGATGFLGRPYFNA